MRILMLTSEYPPRIGGVATHVDQLARALRRQGLAVTVVAPASPAPAQPQAGLINYSPRLRFQPVADWLMGAWCRRVVAARSFDLVHVHGLRPLRAALSTGLPVVFTNHTSGFLQTVAAGGRRLARLSAVIARCHHLIAPSEELIDAARAAAYAGPADYIPNGVDENRFTPGDGAVQRAAWELPEGACVVMLARRLVPKNGVIDAARALGGTVAQVHFVFAGDGPERERMQQEIDRSGAQHRARFLGGIANDDMPALYRAADFCLLPSHMEATSIAGLEAMACGKALIGTRVGGIPALIEDGMTGLLVPPGDPPALTSAVNRLAGAPALATQMGLAARTRVERDFSWLRIAERTSRVYGEVLLRHGRKLS